MLLLFSHQVMSIESVMPFIFITFFSSCYQSFQASESFPMSHFFTLGGQNIGASAPVLPMNIVGWFPLWLTGLISMLSKGLSRVFSNTKSQKHQFISTQPSLWSNSHSYIATGKIIALPTWTFVGKVYLCFLICCLGLS